MGPYIKSVFVFNYISELALKQKNGTKQMCFRRFTKYIP